VSVKAPNSALAEDSNLRCEVGIEHLTPRVSIAQASHCREQRLTRRGICFLQLDCALQGYLFPGFLALLMRFPIVDDLPNVLEAGIFA